MEYQNFGIGKQKRYKGANMKQGLLVMLLLVGCVWLLYQIKHSRNKPDSYGGLPKLVEEYGGVSLGRKGTPSWLNKIDFPTLGKKVHVGEPKKINSGRDDANSGNTDDRSSRSESEGSRSNEESPKIHVMNDSQDNEKEAEEQVRGPPNGMQLQMRTNTEPDGSIEENDEVVNPKTITDGFWIHSFDDENGVPPEVNETEATGGEAHIDVVHEENISNDSKGSRASKSDTYGVISASSENDTVEMNMGSSTSTDVIIDPKVISQSKTVHVDA